MTHITDYRFSTEDAAALVSWLPNKAEQIQRLRSLLKPRTAQVVAAGKYNHGKSTLLNTLAGQYAFAVADRRETREVHRLEGDNVVWIDTPGLDADVQGEDDRLALDAVVSEADILLLVHNARTGELDAQEVGRFKAWLENPAYRGSIAIVVTQKDQLTEDELGQVMQRIRSQVPEGTPVFEVSAVRETSPHDRIRALSGMSGLRQWIDEKRQQTGQGREEAAARLKQDIVQALQKEREAVRQALVQVKNERTRLKSRFRDKVAQAN